MAPAPVAALEICGVVPSVTRPTTMRPSCAASTTWGSTAADVTLTDPVLTSHGVRLRIPHRPEHGAEGASPVERRARHEAQPIHPGGDSHPRPDLPRRARGGRLAWC